MARLFTSAGSTPTSAATLPRPASSFDEIPCARASSEGDAATVCPGLLDAHARCAGTHACFSQALLKATNILLLMPNIQEWVIYC